MQDLQQRYNSAVRPLTSELVAAISVIEGKSLAFPLKEGGEAQRGWRARHVQRRIFFNTIKILDRDLALLRKKQRAGLL